MTLGSVVDDKRRRAGRQMDQVPRGHSAERRFKGGDLGDTFANLVNVAVVDR
jgi:hypothetical protein